VSTKSDFLRLSILTGDPVEAHSPFTQCVAWGPTPVAGGKGQGSDRIVNVVATAGADKVRGDR
jgi:hypothetical protein